MHRFGAPLKNRVQNNSLAYNLNWRKYKKKYNELKYYCKFGKFFNWFAKADIFEISQNHQFVERSRRREKSHNQFPWIKVSIDKNIPLFKYAAFFKLIDPLAICNCFTLTCLKGIFLTKYKKFLLGNNHQVGNSQKFRKNSQNSQKVFPKQTHIKFKICENYYTWKLLCLKNISFSFHLLTYFANTNISLQIQVYKYKL